MSKLVTIPAFVRESKSEVNLPLLEPGTYQMHVKSAEMTTIKSGEFEGKPVLNIALEVKGHRWVWKQLPMWALTAKTPSNIKTWMQMSTGAFFNAIEYDGAEFEPEWLLDQEVTARVGVQGRRDIEGDQNYIITFEKEA